MSIAIIFAIVWAALLMDAARAHYCQRMQTNKTTRETVDFAIGGTDWEADVALIERDGYLAEIIIEETRVRLPDNTFAPDDLPPGEEENLRRKIRTDYVHA